MSIGSRTCWPENVIRHIGNLIGIHCFRKFRFLERISGPSPVLRGHSFRGRSTSAWSGLNFYFSIIIRHKISNYFITCLHSYFNVESLERRGASLSLSPLASSPNSNGKTPPRHPSPFETNPFKKHQYKRQPIDNNRRRLEEGPVFTYL
jgi:hypothetical protein